jgi:hypothetical protein
MLLLLLLLLLLLPILLLLLLMPMLLLPPALAVVAGRTAFCAASSCVEPEACPDTRSRWLDPGASFIPTCTAGPKLCSPSHFERK